MNNPDLQASNIAIQSGLDRLQREATRILHEHHMDLLKSLCVAVARRDGGSALTSEALQNIRKFVNEAIPVAIEIKEGVK